MAAIGQGGGGGAAAGGDGGAQAPAAAPGTQPGAAPNTDNDPFGFAAATANAPEHLRELLQTEFDRVAPSLTERLNRYQPVEPFLERLSPLLERVADEQGQPTDQTILDGLLDFYAMTGDEERADQFADWWERVGEAYGFFPDEGEGEGGEGAAAAPEGSEDPRDAKIAQLEARLTEFETRSQQSEQQQAQQQAVNEAAQQISTELTSLMRAAQIDGHDDQNPLQTPAAKRILALAMQYGEDEQAIPKAVAEYLEIQGGSQADLIRSSGQDVSTLEALQAALSGGGAAPAGGQPAPGPTLGRGAVSHQPDTIRDWGSATEIARERMRQAGHV